MELYLKIIYKEILKHTKFINIFMSLLEIYISIQVCLYFFVLNYMDLLEQF